VRADDLDDVIYSDDGDTLTYFRKGNPRQAVALPRMPLVEAAFVARDWHGGQFTGLYRLSCGSLDYDTVRDAGNELCAALAKAQVAGKDMLSDEYYGAELAASHLRTASDRISAHLTR